MRRLSQKRSRFPREACGFRITVRPGDVHRMEALEDSVLLEASAAEFDDVIGLEDPYGRS